jgi:hypothetical protein
MKRRIANCPLLFLTSAARSRSAVIQNVCNVFFDHTVIQFSRMAPRYIMFTR